MLKTIVNLIKLPMSERLCPRILQTLLVSSNLIGVNRKYLHITPTILGHDRKTILGSIPRKDEGVAGEGVIDIDRNLGRDDIFPDMNSPNTLFDGIPYKEIPIVNIKCSPNNTLLTLTNHDGTVQIIHTCGMEGFKTARKATNIAAQSTALTLCNKALAKGYKTIRVRVRGLGPGRSSAIQGLQMGGMNIVSITDFTRVTWTPLRPRKAKRL